MLRGDDGVRDGHDDQSVCKKIKFKAPLKFLAVDFGRFQQILADACSTLGCLSNG